MSSKCIFAKDRNVFKNYTCDMAKKVYHKKILLRAPWVQWRHVGFAVDDFGTNLGGNFAVP